MNKTFGKLVIGFETWYKTFGVELQKFFTPDIESEYGTLEDFTIEVFFEWKDKYPQFSKA